MNRIYEMNYAPKVETPPEAPKVEKEPYTAYELGCGIEALRVAIAFRDELAKSGWGVLKDVADKYLPAAAFIALERAIPNLDDLQELLEYQHPKATE